MNGITRSRTLPALLICLAAALARPAAAQEPMTGTVIAGAALAVQIGVEVKNAIQELGTAIVYTKVKNDGPDSDDRLVDYDYDRDRGWDWYLDAESDVHAQNNADDKEETPYTPGDAHWAEMRLHYSCTGGKWGPNPVEDDGNGKMQEFWGAAFAFPDDDPGKKDNKTLAAAVGAFSADGKSVDFCYSGSDDDGTSNFQDVDKRPCPQGGSPSRGHETASLDSLPAYTISKAGAFLQSIDMFRFESMGGDLVRIVPQRAGPIDLFHSYLQQTGSPTIFPLLRGKTGTVLQYSRDYYNKRCADAALVTNESPTALADLTIAGAAVELDSLVLARAGRTDDALLLAYFGDATAVRILGPEHAQGGYTPAILWRTAVTSGQDVSTFIGRDYRIPPMGDPADGLPGKTLFGVMFGVRGDIDDAVLLAINTDGHWLRASAIAGTISAPSSGGATLHALASTTEFDTGELEFHDEDLDWIESEANANSGNTALSVNCIFQVDASAYLPGPMDMVGLHGGVMPLPSVTQPGLPMRDDGLYPDAVAGDRIYATLVPFAPGTPRILHYQFDYNGVLECAGQGDRVAYLDDQLQWVTLPARGIDCCTVTDRPMQHVFAVDMRTAAPPPMPGEMVSVIGDHVPLPPVAPGMPLFDDGVGFDALAGDNVFTGVVVFPPRTPFRVEHNYARNTQTECDGHTIRLLALDDATSGHNQRKGVSAGQQTADQWFTCGAPVSVSDPSSESFGILRRFARSGASPFTQAAVLEFELARPAHVSVHVIDARGARVADLVSGFRSAGRHTVRWTAHDAGGRSLPSGVYEAQIAVDGTHRAERLVLLR